VMVAIGIGVLALRTCSKRPDIRDPAMDFANPVYAPAMAVVYGWERTNPAYDSAGDAG